MGKVFFVTGTDTGVGKTLISACLCKGLKNLGKTCFYLKPIQTGSPPETPEDPLFVLRILNEKENPLRHVIYNFKLPASPHLAARVEGKRIDVKQLKDEIKSFFNKYEVLIIEGAGGVMVPITEDYLTIDLIKDLEVPVILVSRTKLGTLNHTLLTVEALKRREIPIVGLIFNFASQHLTIVERDNIEILEKLTGIQTIGIVPEVIDIKLEFDKLVNSIELRRML